MAPAPRRSEAEPVSGAPAVDDDGTTYFATPADFDAWLAQHGATEDVLWVGFHRKETGVPSMTWAESVDEALCHGWIDGVRQKVDERRYRIRFTRRRAGSRWSKRNLARVEVLVAEGRMAPAGRAAFEARSEDRSGQASSDRERPPELPPAYRRRLEGDAAAWGFFRSQPPGYRNTALHWVMAAKREETRERRLRALIEDSANGLRIKPLRR